jgi:hypothetical protein
MDKSSILKRKADLEAVKDELLAKLNAASGGIYECDYWLSVIDGQQSQKAEVKENA